MHLAEMMSLRQTICAGALVTVTERCPLHCAHCSSAATAQGRQLGADALLGLLKTFTPDCRPEILMLTGGEPLMRPDLVVAAAETARAAGTRTAVLSGAFFARREPLPTAIRRVARAVDHFSLSLDVFHEREVPRDNVFAALRALLDIGVATSLHLVGKGGGDPYLAEVTEQVTGAFGDDVPMLVSEIRPVGRAAAWIRSPGDPADPAAPDGASVEPCAMAAWPVITADGVVSACCNQDVVDGRKRPDHLILGELGSTTWPALRERARQLPLLRMIRTVGPAHIAERANAPGCATGGYCGTCHQLGASPPAVAWAERTGRGAVGEVLQDLAIAAANDGGPVALLRRHGSSRYAHLVGAAGIEPEGRRP
jgi:pyruvate-formate lyase-activating enzyme